MAVILERKVNFLLIKVLLLSRWKDAVFNTVPKANTALAGVLRWLCRAWPAGHPGRHCCPPTHPPSLPRLATGALGANGCQGRQTQGGGPCHNPSLQALGLPQLAASSLLSAYTGDLFFIFPADKPSSLFSLWQQLLCFCFSTSSRGSHTFFRCVWGGNPPQNAMQ